MAHWTRRRRWRAIAALVAGIFGLLTAMGSGLAMVPRVRLVEVLTLVASAIGAGAALTVAVAQFRHARTDLAANQGVGASPEARDSES